MREFELIIDKALSNGLSPEYIIPINAPFLFQALGFRSGAAGLEAFAVGTNPLPVIVDIHYNWPFPQFIEGEKFNFLVVRDLISGADIIYSVSDDNLTVSLVFTIIFATFGTGWLVDVADFGEYALMTNGVAMVFWNVSTSAWNVMTSTATIPLLGTICNFKSQIVGGNVRTAWHDTDSTSYIWSKIGKIDFTPDLENEAGYRRCPYGGEVYHVRRLEESVVGYSSGGITLLTLTEESFKFTELSAVGLANRGAISGGLKRQVYVGEDLIIREITNQGIKEIGYRRQMEQLDSIGKDIIVTHDKFKDDFYISNSVRTFLLSRSGMTEIQQNPSAVWRRDQARVHLLPSTISAGFLPIITTEKLDMGYKGQKTIQTLETDAFSITNPQAAVEFSNDLQNISSTNFTAVNNMGIATVPVAGNLFRFKLRFDSILESFQIGYIKSRYKMTDLRGIRGVYAPPIRGQA